MANGERFSDLPRQIREAGGDPRRLGVLADPGLTPEEAERLDLATVRSALSHRLKAPLHQGGAGYSGVDARALTELIQFNA